MRSRRWPSQGASWSSRLATGERGTGMISTLLGVTFALAFLFVAAQVLVHLYATSVVSGAAYEAARLASGSQPAPPEAAATHGRALLGSFAEDVSTFEVTRSDDAVRVRVVGESPALVPAAFGRLTGIGVIDRSVVVRTERLVCDGC